MRIDENGIIIFQEGGPAYDHLARYAAARKGKKETSGGGPNDPNFNFDLYNSLLKDSYMGGYTGYGPDLNALLEGTLDPTGIMLDQDAIAKAIAEYQALQSLVQSQPPALVAAPTTTVTAPPATVTTPPAGNPPGILSSVTSAVKNSADSIMKAIQDIFPFWNQAQVVINPVSGKATIVFGTPPSGAPVVQAGTLPRSNTNVGVTTGVPLLDQVINDILGRSGGLNTGSIKDEIIKIIAAQAGVDAATAAAVIGGDLDQIASQVNTVLADRTANLGIDLTKDRDEDVVVPNVPVDGKTVVGNDTITGAVGNDTITGAVGNDTITGAVGNDTITGAVGNDTITGAVGNDTITGAVGNDTITGAVGNDTLAGGNTTVVGDDKTVVKKVPALVKETSPAAEVPALVRAVVPDSPDLVETLTQGNVDGAGNSNTGAPIQQPQSTQDMYSVSTEQAGLADIGTPYDLNASLLDNIMRILAEKEAGDEETELYGGGSVNGYNATDELIKLLRG